MTSAEGTSSFKIADAYVLVGANLDERSVTQTINQAQKQIERSPLNITVNLDKKSLNAAAATVREEVKQLNKDAVVKLGVEVDGKQLADASGSILAAADDLSKKATVELHVGLDSASIATTDARLKAATTTMGRQDAINLRINADGLSEADNEVKTFSNHWTRLATLISTGVAIGAGPIEALGLTSLLGVFTAIGVVAEKDNASVKASFKDMEDAAKHAAVTGFTPLVGTLDDIEQHASRSASGLQVVFERAAMAISPEVDVIGDDLIDSVQRGVTQSEPVLQRLPKLATSIGDSFGNLEKGAVGLVQNLDVGRAVQGWNALTGAVSAILPPFGIVLNTIAPVSSALITEFGGAVSTVEREVGEAAPITRAFGVVLGDLSVPIQILGPPVLALVAGTKLLTGSWNDFSGAGNKVKSLLSDLPGKYSSLAQMVGITTDKQRQLNIGAAQAAVEEAELARRVDEEAVAEAEEAVALENTAKNSELLAAAKRQLMASTVAATEAEAEFDAVSEASSFSLGPAGLAIGVLAAGLALFAGKSKDAGPPTQDLTADLKDLASAAPGAAGSVLNGNTALQDLVTKAKAAGVDVNAMTAAINAGADATKQFKAGVDASTASLGNQNTQLTTTTANGRTGIQTTHTVTESIKDLSNAVNDGSVRWDELTPKQTQAVHQYNDLKAVSDQLGVSVGTLSNQQGALGAVTLTAKQQSDQWNHTMTEAQQITTAYGGDLSDTALQMRNFAAEQQNGQFSMEAFTKAQVSAAGTMLQAQTQFQNLDAAVTSARQNEASAAQSVVSANNQLMSSAQGVADAEHSEGQSIEAVADARAAVTAAQTAAGQANKTYLADLQAIKVAEQAVTAARQAAVLALQAEQRSVLDQADTQAEAELRLFDAQQAVNKAGLQNSPLKLSDLANQKNINATNETAYQLLLQLKEAQDNLNDVTATSVTLNKQNQKDQKAGVAGNQGVISAQQGVVSAQQQAVAGAAALAASQAAVTKANKAVTDAQYAELQAHQAVAAAQLGEMQAQTALTNAKDSERAAQLQLTSAHDAASRSIDINTVAGNRNVTTLIGLYDAQISAGKSTTDATKTVEVEGQQLGITKGNVDKVITSLGALGGKKTTFGVVGQPSVDLSALIDEAQQQGLNPKTLGFSSSQIGNARASGSGIFPTHAQGGPIGGVGTGTSDSNLIWASKDEHMWTADEVKAAGGHGAMYAMRKAVKGYATGGAIGGDAAAAMRANILLTQIGGMFEATRDAYRLVGVTTPLDQLPAKNPTMPTFSGFGTVPQLSSSAGSNEQIVQSVFEQLYGWGHGPEWAAAVPLIMQESGFKNTAQNPTSTAYGIFQFLNSTWAAYGVPKTSNPQLQAVAGARYINARYGDPIGALAHERAFNWYDQGGLLPQGLSLAMNNTGGSEHKAVFTTDQWNALGALAVAVQRMQVSGGGVQINHHWHDQPGAKAVAMAAQISAQTSWDLSTSAGVG